MRSNTYPTSHRDRHSHHNSYSKNQRYNNNSNYPPNRPYSSNRSSQHSHRSAHSTHTGHNTHPPYNNHANRSSFNHSNHSSQQRRHPSLHSMNGPRNTHNLSSHSNRIRNNHHNNSTSHRPHPNHAHSQSRSRNIRHSAHSAHTTVHRTPSNNNNNNNRPNTYAHPPTTKARPHSSVSRISRSRNIRNLNTSHSHTRCIVNLIDTSSNQSNHNNNNNNNTNAQNTSPKQKQPCIPTAVDTLENTMYQLSFASQGYKFDYQSKINMSLEAAKQDTKRLKFGLNPRKVREWAYKTDIERKHHVRDYMRLCLELINNLMAMDEAIDFIFAPNDCGTNPEFYAAFERVDEDKNGRNMCLEWIQNLLYSDAYETVDHFAADVRLIFKNIFNAFGYEHEWSKNARVVELEFEKGLVGISRQIMNAEDVFIANGNPSQDPQQIECMNLEENKRDIEACVERLRLEREREREREKENANEEHSKGTRKGETDHKSNAKLKEKEDKKAERNKYLENIERNKRKRASKQKLKPRISIECEEGEIQQIKPLDECKLDETDVWFEFIGSYAASARDIQRVIMICEGLSDDAQFKRYKSQLESIGSDLRLNLKNKSATIQCKIYEILQGAKNRITSNNPLSLSVLQDLMEKKSKQRNMKKRMQQRKEKNKILDPYSNEAMEEKRKLKLEKERENEMKLKQEKMEKECKQKTEMDIDEDSEGSFDDNLYFDHDMAPMHVQQDSMNKIAKATATNTITKELPQNGGYLPIRPDNVDEFAIDNVQTMVTSTDEDNTKWDRFKYTKQQQESDEEIPDF